MIGTKPLTLTITSCPSWRLVQGVTVTASAARRTDGLAVVDVARSLAGGDDDPLPHPAASKATESKDPTTPTAHPLIPAKLSTRHPNACRTSVGGALNARSTGRIRQEHKCRCRCAANTQRADARGRDPGANNDRGGPHERFRLEQSNLDRTRASEEAMGPAQSSISAGASSR